MNPMKTIAELYDFSGKTILVTGASGGLGAGIAGFFAGLEPRSSSITARTAKRRSVSARPFPVRGATSA